MPLPPGFCFITGFGPATRTLEKIAGALGQPIKVAALVHDHHGPAAIDGMVGAETELAARLQLGCDHVDRSRIHHAPLGMTRLGPGVRMKQIDKAERRSEEHTSELQSLMRISYAVFCLKKKKKIY